MRVARVIAITFGIGLALWLIPASVHFVDWTQDGPSRVAVVAPLAIAWWALGLSAAAAILLWRAREAVGDVLAPLALLWLWVLPYLPWLPDRVPVLLVLAGPLRWAIAGAAVTWVVGRIARAAGWTARAWAVPGRTTVFVLSFVLYAALGLRSVSVVGLAGDEPQYLMITQSLLADGDLQIENNHRQRDYRSFSRTELPPDFMRRGQNGAIYSIHAPGLPALLLPAYAIAGHRGAVVMMALVAALAAVAIFELAALVAGAAIAWAVWAAICLTVPFNPYAWAIFPEMAGAAIVAWSALWLTDSVRPRHATQHDHAIAQLTRAEGSPAAWLARGLILALLPWLHTKFIIFLAGFTILLLWQMRARVNAAVALLIPIVASVGAWFLSFYVIYGTPNPEAPYGTYARDWVKLENLPRGVLGLLFDQKFGLLVYAPIYLSAAAGVGLGLRDRRWRVPIVALTLIALAFVASSARLYMWWGGWSAPARFLVPVLPLLVPAMALVFARARHTRWNVPLMASLAVSLLISAAGVIAAERLLLFSDAHGVARLVQQVQGSAPLSATLPTFTEADWSLAALRPPRYPPRVREESIARGRIGLAEAFDPDRRRAFDYATSRLLTPDEWRRTGTLLASAFDPGRAPLTATRVEPIAGPAHAALAYVDDNAYPEGGVFWTRGRNRARVLLTPGGRRGLTVIAHIGPAGGHIDLRVGADAMRIALGPNDTRSIDFDLPPDAAWVSIAVQSSSAFRPSEIDPQSGDHRLLGAQVRIVLR